MTRRPKPPASSPPQAPVTCPVEDLGREFAALGPLEQSRLALPVVFQRRDSIMRAAPALQAQSVHGALFQMMLISMNEGRLKGSRDEMHACQIEDIHADITSCVFSVVRFLEMHFGVDRVDVTGDYELSAELDPFTLLSVAIPPEGSNIRSASE